jgi:hypothetical protein
MIYRIAIVFAVALAATSLTGLTACAQDVPVAQQLTQAVTPLPTPLQAGAAVLGYRAGKLVPLREGTNVMVCLADDPTLAGFHAACYHRDLEPFMARGRALRAAGHERPAVDSARAAEIEAGTLAMPQGPRALYSLSSDDEFDPVTGSVPNASGLHVIYMAYATEETTGISTAPARDRPWLMFPGKPWAHVMISK